MFLFPLQYVVRLGKITLIIVMHAQHIMKLSMSDFLFDNDAFRLKKH